MLPFAVGAGLAAVFWLIEDNETRPRAKATKPKAAPEPQRSSEVSSRVPPEPVTVAEEPSLEPPAESVAPSSPPSVETPSDPVPKTSSGPKS